MAVKSSVAVVVLVIGILVGLGIGYAVKPVPEVAKPGAGMYFRMVTHGGDDPFWAVVHKGMLDACEELGCSADMDLCGGVLAVQTAAFASAVAMKPDGIAVVINDDTAWDVPVASAIAAGIPVIGMNNDDTEHDAGNARLCYIGQSERRAGYMIARRCFLAGQAKGWDLTTAHVAMPVEVPGAMYGVVRSQGIRDAMAELGITSYEIIDAGGLEMTTVEARETAYLLAHPETKFIFGLGGICTDRATDAMKAAGKAAGEVIGGGFDCCPGTLTGLREGYMEATIDQQQYLQGYLGIYMLYLYKKYGFTPNIDTGGFLVDVNTIGLIEKLSPLHIR